MVGAASGLTPRSQSAIPPELSVLHGHRVAPAIHRREHPKAGTPPWGRIRAIPSPGRMRVERRASWAKGTNRQPRGWFSSGTGPGRWHTSFCRPPVPPVTRASATRCRGSRSPGSCGTNLAMRGDPGGGCHARDHARPYRGTQACPRRRPRQGSHLRAGRGSGRDRIRACVQRSSCGVGGLIE